MAGPLHLPHAVLALLGILAVALFVGRSARRITPVVELALLALVAAIVLGEFLSWSEWEVQSMGDVVGGLLGTLR